MAKWTSTAGPIQTKKVNKALRDLSWEGRTYNELSGIVGGEERTHAYTEMFGGTRPDVSNQLTDLGERFRWTITRENYTTILSAIEEACGLAKENRPTRDTRQTVEQIRAEREERETQRTKYEEEQKKEKIAQDATREQLLKDFTYLTTIAKSGKSPHAAGSANLKMELERSFPGVAFSVISKTFSMGDSIDYSWTDGPTTEEAEKISGKYQEGHFDGMTDMYEYSEDNVFPSVFGGAKYVHGQRHESVALKILATKELGRDLGPEWFDEWGNIKDGCFAVDFHQEICQEIYRKAREMRGPMPEPKMPGNGGDPANGEAKNVVGITIRRNEEHNGIEILFTGKPEQDVIDTLKSYGFRWSPRQHLWYSRYDEGEFRSIHTSLAVPL